MNEEIPHLNTPSIDVFISNRCNLRCSHCFVGEDLNLNLDMDFGLFSLLIDTAKNWNTTEITFLGGEPTMHPQFIAAIELAQSKDYRTRIVTNGQASYSRFLDDFSGEASPFVCFSLDGSEETVHDSIRGRGSFRLLRENIERTRSRGIRMAGIVSVSRQNAGDVERILYLCDTLQLEYVNIHYVTNRGFASPDIVLSVDEWRETYTKIAAVSKSIRPELRVEKTFFAVGEAPLRCAVVEKSNLMFYPDGRVFMCMMFIDLAASHSFIWTSEGLKSNNSLTSEQKLVSNVGRAGCPAMHYVNGTIEQEALASQQLIQCIYAKERLGSSMKNSYDSLGPINFESVPGPY